VLVSECLEPCRPGLAGTRGESHIGIPEQHHSISHHGNDPEKLAKYAKIATYQIQKFADFIEKLKAAPPAPSASPPTAISSRSC
jgi:hypothetical protein